MVGNAGIGDKQKKDAPFENSQRMRHPLLWLEYEPSARTVAKIEGQDRIKKKKDPPLQKPQEWGTLRVFVFLAGFNACELTSEELARLM